MATYLILNILFLAFMTIVLRPKFRQPGRPWIVMIIILLIMTAIFDSLIIYFQIVGYDTAKILGLYIGLAPVEDFFYAILSALLIPIIWKKLGVKHVERS